MDLELVKASLAEATEKLRNAKNFEEVKAAFAQYNREYIKVTARVSRLFLATYSNILDQDAATAFFTEASVLSDLQQYAPFAKAVAESEYYDQIAEYYGPLATQMICRLHEINQIAIDMGDDFPNCNEETQEYQTLAVMVGGDYMSKADEFDTILDKIVQNKTALSKLMGCDNFCDASAQIYSRFGYGEKELMWLCEEIRTKIVPYYADFAKRYEGILAEDDPTAIDLVNGLRGMMEKVGKEASDYFNELNDGGHIDAEPSANKMPGMGLQRFVEDERIGPLIVNPSGSFFDNAALAHEFGHSLQERLSFDNNELATTVLGPVDMMEIPSRTMELLTLFFADELFHEAKTYKIYELNQLLRSTISFCMGTVFEHWLYTNISASAQERKEKYIEVYRAFYPMRNKTDEEIVSSMYEDSLLYISPKYQISYVLAWFHAAELAVAYIDKTKETYERYIAICKKLAFWEYPEFVKQFGLKNVFEEGSAELFLSNLAKLEAV